jgi:predicted nucleic acid-binding Zn ribbon protein
VPSSREGANEPRRVAVSLPEAARIMGARGAIELAQVRAAWPEAVGPQAAAHAWPKALSKGVLTVATDHHAWATELRLLASELLRRLQVKCPSVRSIVVVVSPGEGSNW